MIVSVLELCKGHSTDKEKRQDKIDPGQLCVVKEHDTWTEEEDSLSVQVDVDMPVQMVSIEELDAPALYEDDPTSTTSTYES